MLLERLYLANVRGLSEIDISFSAGVNFLVGGNGAGKSTILEAIYLLSSGFSFRTHFLRELIAHKSDGLFIEATIAKSGHKRSIAITFDGESRRILIGGMHVERTSQLLGHLLCSISTHEDLYLLFGSPSERRREMDLLIAQNNPAYVGLLARYNRVIQQRNRLLRDRDIATLASWDAQLIELSPKVSFARNALVMELMPYFLHELNCIMPELAHTISLKYRPVVEEGDNFSDLLYKKRDQELRASASLFGAHRDELGIYSGVHLAKKCLSMGQAKVVTLALRLASWSYLRQKTGTEPIFLLDDIESFVSKEIINRIKQRLEQIEQTLIAYLPSSEGAKREFQTQEKVKEIVLPSCSCM
jgi:DNA replication and repair protein RecF